MNFIARFFLLVMVVGFAELYVLVEVATRLSFVATAAACVLTGVVGGALVRQQGLSTLARMQQAMGRGELPAEEIVAGIMLLIVGATLILPGFISDATGFLLLIPAVRSRAARVLVGYLKARGMVSVMGGGPFPGGGPFSGGGPFPGPDTDPTRPPRPRGPVIDIDPDPKD